MKITVKIFERGELLFEKVFDEGVYRGGRSDFADINLPSDSISRSHFEIRVAASNVYLTNMSSGGRIKLNNKQVETSELADGDEVIVGPYRMVVLFGESLAAEPVLGEGPLEGTDLKPEPTPGGDENNFEAAAEAPPEPPADLGEVPEPPPEILNNDGSSSPFQRALSRDVEGTAALNRAETIVEAKPVVAKLVFTEGPRKGEELFIEAYEISLGRSKKADIFLDDEKLSRIHAKITRVGMGFRLIDQRSRNGTYVNGMRILEHPLGSFDTIEIGNSKIKFLIHDMVGGDLSRMGRVDLVESSRPNPPPLSLVDQTKSLQLSDSQKRIFLDVAEPIPPAAPPAPPPEFRNAEEGPSPGKANRLRVLILIGALAAMGVAYWYTSGTVTPTPAPNTPTTSNPNNPATAVGTKVETKGPETKTVLPPSVLSKEFLEQSPEMQRAIEGYYNTALRAADREMYQEAVDNLRKIHAIVPYYKESASLAELYQKRLKEKQAQIANEKAKKDDKQELSILLEDGVQYLKDGEFDLAAERFNYAISIDPMNPTAKKGLKAADLRIRDIDKVPPDRDPVKEKEEQIRGLFEKAVSAYNESHYQDAILLADEITKIELPGRTDYINEANQIKDKARLKQKEQFEPFLIDAKAKYAEGDFRASRELCEEMLKKDPSFAEAKECATKAKSQLNKLAKEAYTHGYILESMNRIEEAKQYWNRAKNYVQPGDAYYEKVLNKLEQYQ